MGAPTVTVKNLAKSFGRAQVLAGLDLVIEPSRINFIIGQSGGGKSVLLKNLVGLMTPDQGEIWYDQEQMAGRSLADWNRLRLRMAFLFQDGALFDSLSVGENVGFPLWIHQRATQAQAAQKALARLRELDMAPAFHHRPSDLSAGEKKRVALARALIMEPEILFFDEPTTGLDPLLSEQVDDLIKLTRAQTGATMVVVSHDIPATLSLADRVAMVYGGRIILSGPPEEFRRSSDPVVRQFLTGEANGPMGFLD
ncbi:MAG: ATP-binding cassette domain-containing protein [Candidatus Adiutrix sp.]|jgi:phospholipid/cholesterol/gamma-HCH transport system ATP-binding protein|nr:ATP-binding cassette domain-containing protein [Candidatus Adiutrix sp.]